MRWLISYADFITLLFALFVVLYASSQLDKRKIGKLALSIQVAFQELGVFETSNTKIPLSDSEAVPFSQVQGTLNPNQPAPVRKEIQSELEKALAPEIFKHVVNVQLAHEGLVVSLLESARKPPLPVMPFLQPPH